MLWPELVAFVRSALPVAPWAEPVHGPYLYRWDLPPGLRTDEERLIAAGSLPRYGLAAGRRSAAVGSAKGPSPDRASGR